MMRLLPILILALGVSGCSGLNVLNQAAVPSELYALTPKSTFLAIDFRLPMPPGCTLQRDTSRRWW